MREIANAREIALYLHYLKANLKGARNKLSDKDLADKLNRALGKEYFDPAKVNDLRNVREWVEGKEQSIVLQAIEKLGAATGLKIDTSRPIPAEIEDQFRSRLPAGLQHPVIPRGQEGDAVGELSNILAGAWNFFYVSPTFRDGCIQTEIKSIGAFFPHTTAASRAIGVTLISGHAKWEGIAFVNETRLYMVCTEIGRSETAFFLTNSPLVKRSPMFVGIGAALARPSGSSHRPAAGVLCFGRKWQPSDASKCQEVRPCLSPDRTAEIVDRLVKEEQVPEADEAVVRSYFCRTYRDMSDIKAIDSKLYDFVQNAKVNGENGFPLKWLHLEW